MHDYNNTYTSYLQLLGIPPTSTTLTLTTSTFFIMSFLLLTQFAIPPGIPRLKTEDALFPSS